MHKYLKEAGFDKELYSDTLPKDDDRRPEWAKQRREYSMDERETWNLGHLSITWLYEHIKMYLDFSDIDYIDLNYHKFKVDEKELNQKELLQKILHQIELYFNLNDCFYIEKFGKNQKEIRKEERAIDKLVTYDRSQKDMCKEIWRLWGIVCPSMWW
jgi:O6-methylguanine-DNA--protein-cysteine methyltransferase